MGDSLTSSLGSIFNQSDNEERKNIPNHQEAHHTEKNGYSRKKTSYRKKHRATRREEEVKIFQPGTVTGVKPQAKNAARVSVFVDEVFSFGCFKSVWLRHGVEKGNTLSESQHAQLMDEEQRCRLQHYWMDLLSRRNHSAGELRRKALQKGYEEHHFDALIEDFRDKNFIDERSFAKRLAEEMRERKRWGPQRIRAALLQKSIPASIIDEALEETQPADEFEQLEVLTSKNSRRLSREKDPMKRKKKLFDYLTRKGHSPALIMQHIERLLAHIDKVQQ